MPDVFASDSRISASAERVFFDFGPAPWQGQVIKMHPKYPRSAFGSFRAYRSSTKAAVGASSSPAHLVKMFLSLAGRWEKETENVSSLDAMVEHPAYRAIVALGPRVLPFILDRMKSSAAYWFPALAEITGTDPVPPGDRGDFLAMRRAWLDWASRNADR